MICSLYSSNMFYLASEWGNSFICNEGSLTIISHLFLRNILFIRSYLTVDNHLVVPKCARAEPIKLSLCMCNIWKLMLINRWGVTWTEINVANVCFKNTVFSLSVFNDGSSRELMSLSGTIPVPYRGMHLLLSSPPLFSQITWKTI